MIRLLTVAAAFVAAGFLSACGADGEPERPEARPPTGISISGTAEFGIGGSF